MKYIQTRRRAGLLAAAALCIATLSAAPALAACGDDVGGKRVPCRCGDVVVSDTRLQPDDPVVRERCPADGLIVRAQPGAESITLDLGGLTIHGTGLGAGIRVIDGGRLGAVVLGGGSGRSAEVVGFGTGFRARGQRSVRELRDIGFVANARDGAVIRGAGTVVDGVRAERNGRDGVRAGGRAVEMRGVEAQQNRRYGLRVTSPEATAEETVSAGNVKGQTKSSKRATVTEENTRP